MKIAFIVDSFPVVSETFIFRQITSLVAAGHKIMIFAGSAADKAALDFQPVDQELLNSVRVYNRKPGNPLARIVQAVLLAPILFFRSPSALIHSLNVFRYGREALSLNYFFQAFAFSEAVGADVVVAHFGPNGLVGARMKEWGALRGRLICFFHAYDLTSYVAFAGETVYRPLFRYCTKALAISERGRRQLAALGCPSEKLGLLRMGLDPKEYSFFPRILDPEKPLRIVSVARLVEKKGIAFGIEAVGRLAELGLMVQYLVIGDGPLRAELEALSLRRGMKERVVFAGSRDAGFVRREMASADIFLLPSVTAGSKDEEGIPVVLMEALASGLSVVACASGAVDEIIMDGKTGVLVPPGDPESLKNGVLRLLNDPFRAREMAQAGHLLVEREYNIQELVKEFEVLMK